MPDLSYCSIILIVHGMINILLSKDSCYSVVILLLISYFYLAGTLWGRIKLV